jgi:hypothetical protein
MDETMTLQGREITKDNIELVKATDQSQSIWRIAPGFPKSGAFYGIGVLNGQIKDNSPPHPSFEIRALRAISPCPGVALPVGAVARSLSPMFYIILLLLPVLSSVLKPVEVQLVTRQRSSLVSSSVSLSRYHYLSFQLARSERTWSIWFLTGSIIH